MTLSDVVDLIARGGQHGHLYHFTDTRNFPLIKQNGLLSKNEMRHRGIWPPAPSGNQWSWDADDRKGVSAYVSLCMTRNHPMCYRAKSDGRIDSYEYLCIKPAILLQDGVLFANGIANGSQVELEPFMGAIGGIDLQVLYERTDWRDPAIKQRLKVAEKYEILVPRCVGISMIAGIARRR